MNYQSFFNDTVLIADNYIDIVFGFIALLYLVFLYLFSLFARLLAIANDNQRRIDKIKADLALLR